MRGAGPACEGVDGAAMSGDLSADEAENESECTIGPHDVPDGLIGEKE